MLESLAAWILNHYIGEYFGNVNTDQLSIALHHGEVELEGLPLRHNSFRHLGLPLEVCNGYIGKISLKIPVYRLKSEPWIISIDELFLIARPITDFTYSEDEEKQNQHEYKMSQMDSLESRWKSLHESNTDAQSYYASSYTSWLSYGTSFVTNIIENLQLNIRSVHIRYEDAATVSSSPFACGIVIRNLSAQSTDENWSHKYVNSDTSEFLKKLLKLEGFSVYWDTDVTLFSHLKLEQIVHHMRSHIEKSTNGNGIVSDHDYVISPVSGKALLIRNCSEKPLKSRSEPRIVMDLQLEQFPITLTVIQYRYMLEWFDSFGRANTVWKYRKWRPSVAVKNNAKLWWEFAVNAHLEPFRLKKSRIKWQFIKTRICDINKYCNAFYAHLTHPETLTQEVREEKERIEMELSFDELCSLREIVFEKCHKNDSRPNDQPLSSAFWSLQNWFPQWYSTAKSESALMSPETEESKDISEAVNVNPSDDFINTLNVMEDDSLLRRDSIFAQLYFTIQHVSFSLMAFNDGSPKTNIPRPNFTPLLELEFSMVKVGIETRPRTRSHRLEIKLLDLSIKDKITNNIQFPFLISPHKIYNFSQRNRFSNEILPDESDDNDDPLFELVYETKPVNEFTSTAIAAYNYLRVHSRPLEIVYNSHVFDTLRNFFSTNSSKFDSFNNAAKRRYEEFKQQTKSGIQQTLQQIVDAAGNDPQLINKCETSRWRIELDIHAPQIIIPEDISHENSTLVILDLGRLQLRNIFNRDKNRDNKDGDDSDTFETPSSTPVKSNISEISGEISRKSSHPMLEMEPIFGPNLRKILYENFLLDLSDMQVLVAQSNDNWKFGLSKGSGAMHVVNRFSISLQIGYRLNNFAFEDQSIPYILINGKLPKLATYLNEHKLKAIILSVKNVFSNSSNGEENASDVSENGIELNPQTEHAFQSSFINNENVLFQSMFCIDDVSVALQSRGENLVEFQVSGVEMKVEKSVNISSISLCVRELLLIDAHQRFGTEYDILLASHHKISMDSSGRLSDVNYGSSPKPENYFNSAHEFSNEYALIAMEYLFNNIDSVQTVNVCFNNLDVVANQETIIELVTFFKRIMPSNFSYHQKDRKTEPNIDNPIADQIIQVSNDSVFQTNLNFEFHRLNVLLLRANSSVTNDSMQRKLAIATLCGANISVQIGIDEILINGSLSGLQVFDLVTDPLNNKHKRVVSIGIDSYAKELSNLNMRRNYSETYFEQMFKIRHCANEKALTFKIRRLIDDNILEVNTRMASLCYVHSARLLQEFTSCAVDFKEYIAIVGRKIKTAATEMALGIVSKGRSNSGSLRRSFNKKNKREIKQKQNDNKEFNGSNLLSGNSFIEDLRLDIYLQTPVIILPISLSNYDVMVAHLGHISLKNHMTNDMSAPKKSCKERNQKVYAEIRDLSLYSLDSSKNIDNGKDINCMTAEELYSCNVYGIPILQETIIEVLVERKNSPMEFPADEEQEKGLNSIASPIEIIPNKKFVFPLKSSTHEKELTLTIKIPNINLRVSYNDMLMFIQIMNTLSFEFLHTKTKKLSHASHSIPEIFDDIFATPSNVKQLEDLGFIHDDCVTALIHCQGSINDAALWLTKHGRYHSIHTPDLSKAELTENSTEFNTVLRTNYTRFTYIEIRMQNGTLCLIDDCNENDVPLLEINTNDLYLRQRDNNSILEGCSKMVFFCDYYNRALSGWEPFVEPWKFQLSWNLSERRYQLKTTEPPKKKLSVHINSKDILNVNITSNFLEVYYTVSKLWFEDIFSFINGMSSNISFRHRTPFVPFAIKNETGCGIKFHPVLQESESEGSADQLKNRIGSKSSWPLMNNSWIHIEPNEIYPFSFPTSAKTRHLDSHISNSHKIVVSVDGWKSVFPVSVDKVGVFFREATPIDRYETARIIFTITSEQKARKLITVRSALLISNKTSNAMELKFDNTNESLYLNQNSTVPVPLKHVRTKMRVRPCDVGVNMCVLPIQWEHVRKCNEIYTELQHCIPLSVTRNQHSSYSTSSPYRYCVMVERDGFPLDVAPQGPGLQSYKAQPAHTITLLPPLKLENLLPCDLRFYITGSAVIGTIKPRQEISLHFVNTLETFNVEFSMENFPQCKPLTINPGATRDYVTHIELIDTNKRILILYAQISLFTNGASMLTIYSPYWIVNRTGLPLIFKQENSSIECAGQFVEHEMARSISPLLFSFSEPDSTLSCVMRLGKSKGLFPRWCHGFYLEKGTWFRRVRMGHEDKRKPDIVYELGIDVRNGRGRYRDSRIVTISPRYQIENLSSYRIEIAQKFATIAEPELRDYIISILPKSNVSFHWPRTDHDKLLCVRIASIHKCHWSGGFAVTPNTAFHLNIRDDYSKSHFIRVEMLFQGATFFIVFTDANNLPPPIRVDNFSCVPIEFYQTNTAHMWMKTKVRSNSSLPYSWDESTLKQHVTVRAPGGSCATYDMNTLAPGDQLTYENYIYIAFNGTFADDSDDEKVTVASYLEGNENRHQLVFDVPEGSKLVFITRKERGKRSQLWRMDSAGRIIHEGSSPPIDARDPLRPSFIRADKNSLVLDISSNCAIPGEYVSLALRNPDARRALTQTWTFTSDGRLKCEHPDMYVQPRGGYKGLRTGKEIVLGPYQSLHNDAKMPNGIPIEQSIKTQRMRKGSGVLAVSVIADGPTRVLRIDDIKNLNRDKQHVVSHHWPRSISDPSNRGLFTKFEFQLIVDINNVGFSVVNKYNEELLYVFLQNSIVDLSFNIHEWNVNCSVQNIQADNQLRDAEKSMVLQVSQHMKNIPLPAITVTAQKLIVPNVEAEVFKQLQVSIKDITFNLEEILLLKLFEFLNYYGFEDESDPLKDDNETHGANRVISSVLSKSSRYYFTIFKIELCHVKLSVFTTVHIPHHLQKLKKKSGVKLLRFEDATIQLSPFLKTYALETKRFLLQSIYEHYRVEIKSQAAKILGSVDFLGNPLGFINDVTDGINELINEGSVGGLIRNVTHGVSDSTAKVTSILSDSLGVVTMDQRHQEIRKRIKQESNHHLSAGFKGLGVGIIGGFTSIVTQTYEGVVKEGITGFFSGFGKGIVGTFTKPVTGMLDFTTGAASAFRETSKKISGVTDRVRLSRVGSVGTLLPRYRTDQSQGQELFYNANYISDRGENEMFILVEDVQPNYFVLITSERICFIKTNNKPNFIEYKIELTVEFENLIKCDTICNLSGLECNKVYYIVIIVAESLYPVGTNAKPTKIACDSEITAVRVADQINFAKHAFEERKYSISTL